jgi:hypothetical protein
MRGFNAVPSISFASVFSVQIEKETRERHNCWSRRELRINRIPTLDHDLFDILLDRIHRVFD